MILHTVSNNPDFFFQSNASMYIKLPYAMRLVHQHAVKTAILHLPVEFKKLFLIFFSCKSRHIKIWQPGFCNVCLQLALFLQADPAFKAATHMERPQLSSFSQQHFRWCSHQKVPFILHSALTLLFGALKQTASSTVSPRIQEREILFP